MMKPARAGLLFCFSVAVLHTPWCTVKAYAQVTSLSPSVSDSLSSSSDTEGFNGNIVPGAGNITNSELHTDVSDPTHSQLLGSSLTPLDNPYVSPYANSNPQTGVLTDAQAAVGAMLPSGGRRGEAGFNPGAGSFGSETNRLTSLSSLGTVSMQSAFSGGAGGRAAFSAASGLNSSSGSDQAGAQISPSTYSSAMPTAVAPSAAATGGTQTATYRFTDPVLSGSTAGYEGDLELDGDLPTPSLQTGQFFAETRSPSEIAPLYDFDDGQTQSSKAGIAAAGQVFASNPEYNPSPTGFDDSTRGLAGLPSEASNAVSPLSSRLSSTSSVLSFGITVPDMDAPRLIPSLHTAAAARPYFNFEAAERHEQEQRIIHGVSISQASEIYKQDLRKYRQQAGRALPRRPTRDLGASQPGGGSQDLLGSSPVR